MLPLPEITADVAARLDAKSVRLPNGCSVWTGAKSNGYGQMTIRRKVYRVHRLTWKRKTGADPGELHVLHHCDTPACLEHLFLGTHVENMADMSAKGRTDRTHKAHGETHYNARLTEADVLDIRALCAAGQTPTSVAPCYGVHRATISDIVNRRTWKDL